MRTSVLVGAVLVLGVAAPAESQRIDDLTAGVRMAHEGVLRGDQDSRTLQDPPPRSGADGNLLLQRTLWGAFGGAAVGLPLGFVALGSESDNSMLWVAGTAYLLTTAMVVATHRGPSTKCTSDDHFGRALLGTLAGAGIAAAIASTMHDTNRAGTRAVIAGTGVFFATPLGAALAVSGCD